MNLRGSTLTRPALIQCVRQEGASVSVFEQEMKTRQGRRCSLSRCLSLHLAKRQGAAQGGPESRGTHFYTSLTTGPILLKSLRIFMIN